ncbi:hypothetical protein CF026_23290 [Klebsiella michiganensis]|uniref:hypothetical protein n=1 Tax=Klebsiella michiganensis TaxID=1134687 RepID=UPI0013D765BD|nr:hypothetical protein [Klebsiella michiganensis]MBW5981349.1 hypothetical protein [Klebsiella michiganensis]MBW6001069.1 hypothetical protein [Klebsiella michiganensis]
MEIQSIKESRFNVLAAYARNPSVKLISKEVSWYQTDDLLIVACMIFDYTDGEYAGNIMVRDEAERYRNVTMSDFFSDIELAKVNLFTRIEECHEDIDNIRLQYLGEVNTPTPVEFFTPLNRTRERLDPLFDQLINNPMHLSAKNIIEPMMRWYEDADGNFIEQFQTTGFKQRIWELYLFAMLIENDVVLDPRGAIPDFICNCFYGHFCVEATTVNPTVTRGVVESIPVPSSLAELEDIQRNYYPIKFGSALFSKLRKQYWLKEACVGKPLIFAVTDCLSPESGKISKNSLAYYLYGYIHEWQHDDNGQLQILPRRIDEHRWGGKVIPSGFFNLESSEHISAVIFSNDASFGKFNRMGLSNGFAPEGTQMRRVGTHYNPDPNATEPLPFYLNVNDPSYQELWIEGLDVYHNPNALIPLSPSFFENAAHHYLLPDGNVRTNYPAFQPQGSITRISLPE